MEDIEVDELGLGLGERGRGFFGTLCRLVFGVVVAEFVARPCLVVTLETRVGFDFFEGIVYRLETSFTE